MMMAYNDGFDDINMNIPDSFNRRKLQLPLLFPKPYLKNTSTTQQSCFPHYHPLEHVSYRDTAIAEQKKLMKTAQPQVVVSSRWNPAPEQLRALEELYRRGTRTPSAEQIQNITAQLKRYGKIEGKNVFYWFQNHKARERQKRRRQIMESTPQDQNLMSERKELSGTTRKILDEGQEQITESVWEYNDVSTQRIAKAGAESNRTDGLIQFDELRDQLQINRRNSSFMARNSTWQMTQLYCPPRPPVNNNNNNNNNPSTTTTTTRSASTVRRTLMDQNQLIKKFHDIKNLFNITPFSTETGFNYHHQDHDNQAHEDFYNIGGECDDQTLELFPHGSCGSGTLNGKDSNGTGAPQQFFEFLPLKN